VNYDTRNAGGFIKKVYEASRIRRIKYTKVELGQVIERTRGTRRLLIIDQAHELRDSVFPVLMSLNEQAQMPILLVGTVDLHRRLEDDQDPEFGQLSSRVTLRCDLLDELLQPGRGGGLKQWISADELKRIFAVGKIKFHPDGLQALVKVANFECGHLRRVGNLVRVAAALAKADKASLDGAIGAAHVAAAMRYVAGRRAAGLVETAAAPAAVEATA